MYLNRDVNQSTLFPSNPPSPLNPPPLITNDIFNLTSLSLSCPNQSWFNQIEHKLESFCDIKPNITKLSIKVKKTKTIQTKKQKLKQKPKQKPFEFHYDDDIIDINHLSFSSCEEDEVLSSGESSCEFKGEKLEKLPNGKIKTKLKEGNKLLIPKKMRRIIMKELKHSTIKELCQKYDVTKCTICKWKRNGIKVDHKLTMKENEKKHHGWFGIKKFEDDLLKWYNHQEPNSVTKKKFREVAIKLHQSSREFTASNQFITKFMNKYGISLVNF